MLVGCFKQRQMKDEQKSFTDFVVRDDGGGVAVSVSINQVPVNMI